MTTPGDGGAPDSSTASNISNSSNTSNSSKTPSAQPTETLVLASRSSTRIAMLQAAGIGVEIDPADVDEARLGAAYIDPGDRAVALARAKALKVSERHPGRLVLGGDQVCILEDGPNEGSYVEKPRDPEDHVQMLLRLAARTHAFFPAAVLVKDGNVLGRATEIVRVTFRPFLEPTARAYVATGEGAGSCGGYESERKGGQLIASIDGTQFALMGLPLLGVLGLLRENGLAGLL